MAKSTTVFVCNSCGNSSPKWMGKCTTCGTWNSFTEEVISTKKKGDTGSNLSGSGNARPLLLEEIQLSEQNRIQTGDSELDRVLGGGIVPGSVILLGGQPGIGKSTLLLQLALRLPEKVLYISGEESNEQIKLRAERFTGSQKKCYIYTSTSLEEQLTTAKKIQPHLIIVDSIQTISSDQVENTPGSVTQVRHCAAAWQHFAKENGVPVFLVGHITKGGFLAGPKLLEHLVDTVLQFEGDAHYNYRMIRSVKNRFGSTDELGIYQMSATGLEPVDNPGELLMVSHELGLSGSAITACMEGQRPMMVEVQALVASSPYGTPQRNATGFDSKRLAMLLAVLEKRCGIFFAQQDIFVNLAGGFRIQDPGVDAAVVSAIMSSHQNVSIPSGWCFAGEVGLAGEVRTVQRMEQRVLEAERRGFTNIVLPSAAIGQLGALKPGIKMHAVRQVSGIFDLLFT